MAEALINKSVLQWAFDRAGNNNSLVSKFGKFQDYLSGKAKPTFIQAQDLAKALKIPFGYLFLDKPPLQTEIVPDLRTFDNQINTSLTLKTLLRDIKQKQEWYKDYIIENNEIGCSVVGKFSINSDFNEICNDIISKFNIINLKRSDPKKYINNIIERAEELKILIMGNSILGSNTKNKLEIDEFRGFAIYDDIAPLIFINKNDTLKAQIFTLFHEIAHLWIRESGISSIQNVEIDNNIERFCNKIAAEVLMPKEVFINKFDKLNDDWLLNLEKKFCVSRLAILTRAKDLNLISNNEYKQYRDIELENIRVNLQNRRLKEDFNIPHAVVIQSKYGRLFSKAVVGAVLSEKETYRSGAKLFGETKTSIIDKLAKL